MYVYCIFKLYFFKSIYIFLDTDKCVYTHQYTHMVTKLTKFICKRSYVAPTLTLLDSIKLGYTSCLYRFKIGTNSKG